MTNEEKTKKIDEVRALIENATQLMKEFLNEWKPKMDKNLSPKEYKEVFTRGQRLIALKKIVNEKVKELKKLLKR